MSDHIFECSGCGKVSEDGFKPSCQCVTMVGIRGDYQQVFFLDPAKRDAMAKIICRHLTGEYVSANGSYGNWLCPQNDETANSLCTKIASDLLCRPDTTGEREP